MKYIYLFIGIVAWIAFAYDIEYDCDMITWFWLLGSLLGLLGYVIAHFDEKLDEIKKKCN